MGFFNAMSSINKVNNLLKDLENQVTITQDQVRKNASAETLQNSMNVLKHIHQELINTFSNSSGARVSMFTLFGNKMRMHDILTYSKNVIYNLATIINGK
ncbi:hypothetical protein [Phocaeicola barnesiae]|uniref:hypothetical protein n=1 Tax=Phocaeicola barnesiae TaxID=376804 RepID=UPI0025A49C93|nr:hypothetical protein [Phocaeicola barnesiae]MDM8257665.1 hypothetical protein [Phocaeicola barnesiae]